MKMIFVSSPLRGDIAKNVNNARLFAKCVCDAGHSPVLPHLVFTQFLDDYIDNERTVGIECGMKYLEKSDEVWVFAKDRVSCSAGMAAEVDYAENLGKPLMFIDPATVPGYVP